MNITNSKDPGDDDAENETETLISWLNQYLGMLEGTADTLKGDLETIRVNKIARHLAVIEAEKKPEVIRLIKNIVVGFQDSINKAIKDLQQMGSSMTEDLQNRFNLPPDWIAAYSVISLVGSEIMGPTSRRQMESKVSSYLHGLDKNNGESSSSSNSKGNTTTEINDSPVAANDNETIEAIPPAVPDTETEGTQEENQELPAVGTFETNEECDRVPASDEELEDSTETVTTTRRTRKQSGENTPKKKNTPTKSPKAETPKGKSAGLEAEEVPKNTKDSQDSNKKAPNSTGKSKQAPPPPPLMDTSYNSDADSDSSGKTFVLPRGPNTAQVNKTPEKVSVKKERINAAAPAAGEEENVSGMSSPSPDKLDKNKKIKKEPDERKNEGRDKSANEKPISGSPVVAENITAGTTQHGRNEDDIMDFMNAPLPTSNDDEPMDVEDTQTVVLPSSSRLQKEAENQTKQTTKEKEDGVNTQDTQEPSSSKNTSAAKTCDRKERRELSEKEKEKRKETLKQTKDDKAIIKDLLGSSSDSDVGKSASKKKSCQKEKDFSRSANVQNAVNIEDDPKLQEDVAVVEVLKLDEAIVNSYAKNKYIRLTDYDEYKKRDCDALERQSDSSDSSVKSENSISNERLQKLVNNLTKSTLLITKQHRQKKGKDGETSRRKRLTKKKRKADCRPEGLDSSSDSETDNDSIKGASGSRGKPITLDDSNSESGSEDLDGSSGDNEKSKSRESKSSAQNSRSSKKYYKPARISSDDSDNGDKDARREVIGGSSDSDGNNKRRLRMKREKPSSSGSDGRVGRRSRRNKKVEYDSSDSDFKKRRGRSKKPASDSDVMSVDDSDSDGSDFVTPKKKSSKRNRERDSSSEPNNRKRRKRIIEPKNSSDSDDIQEIPQEDEPGTRKNIRKIISSRDLAKTTKEAEKEEEERRKRIEERQKAFNGDHKKPDSDKLERLVLDFDPDTNEPLIEVDETIVCKLKPHQADGIKFMFNTCFESVEMMKQDKVPGGCILAHCMGLGKTLQTVAFLHTMLTNKVCGIKTALVICPLSTVNNWSNELKTWTQDAGDMIKIHKLYDVKNSNERRDVLKFWKRVGGVGILHYDMFRILADPKGKSKMKESLRTVVKECLLDPGPDIVICDEGHLLKNNKSMLSMAVNNIRTHRRIVLTGTPLQNNLIEYHTMMNFVKPNLLGSLPEFTNRFVNPIKNGQHADSTLLDVRTMKKRTHVLHRKLEGCVQRCDYSILAPYLPPKYEYIIHIKLTEKQEQLYKYYLDNVASQDNSVRRRSLLKYYSQLVKIWSHPIALTMRRNVKDDDEETTPSDNSFIDDGSVSEADGSGSNSNSNDGPPKSKKRTRANPGNDQEADINVGDFGWWNSIFKSKAEMEDINLSGKLVILQEILKTSEEIGDKVLVFSQFLSSLDIIEEFLSDWDTEIAKNDTGITFPLTEIKEGRWRRDIEYFRIDGSTKVSNRHRDCEKFNKKSGFSRAKLFLISTKAGGLGINLYGANRVVIFDTSWNPSQDMQSIFRVYRFGQDKPCYIYRLVARGTMEEKILRRQITKLSLSSRVVDEHQIQRHFKFEDVNEMYQYDEDDTSDDAVLDVPKDRLLADLLMSHRNMIRNYEEFDSLLENKVDEGLSKEEKELAWAEYRVESEREKGLHRNTTNSQQAETYVKVKARLATNYPNATEDQLERATDISLQGNNQQVFVIPPVPPPPVKQTLKIRGGRGQRKPEKLRL